MTAKRFKIYKSSIYTMPLRQLKLIGNADNSFDEIKLFSNMKHISNRWNKIASMEYWKVKFHQSIKVEKNRVVIDDHEYLVNAIDGVLAEINKEMIKP